MSLIHQDAQLSADTRSDSNSSKIGEVKGNYSERESVMTFHEEFFRHQQQQPLYLDDPNQSQDAYQLSENEGLLVVDDTTAGRLQAADSPDVFRCTLPVVERYVTIDKEAIGINAARRKKHARMVVCNSVCSTLSSNRTISPSVDIGSTCGCFRRLRVGATHAASTMTSPIPYNPNGRSAGSNSDGRLRTSIVATEIASKASCCFAMYNTQQNATCISPPSAVQTFSFADTKIGNAVSETDGGLVVRVNSCRGGQHRVDERHNESTSRGIHDGLSLFFSGTRRQGMNRWKTTSSSGPESDLTGNFTLVSRRCTEVRRAFGYSRHRWPQTNEETTSNSLSHRPEQNSAISNIVTEQQTKVARDSLSSATSAWRRLVAGLEVVAVDGRRLLGNCRHVGDTIGLLSLSTGKSYDVLTTNMT